MASITPVLPLARPSAPVLPGVTGPSGATTPALPGDTFVARGPIEAPKDPGNPLTDWLAVPLTAARVMADLGTMLFHPIRTVKGLWATGRAVMGFDKVVPLTAASAPQARDQLHAAVAGVKATGAPTVFGFLARMVDKRAALAADQMRPVVESRLGALGGTPVAMSWPVGGRHWVALDEMLTVQTALAQYPEAITRKAFSGIAMVEVRSSGLQGLARPWAVAGRTLVLHRPPDWLPGTRPVADALMGYLNEAGKVSVAL